MSNTRSINTIGLFSGGGGLDLGFAASGFDIVLSSDIDFHSCKTLEINQGQKSYFNSHAVIQKDINSLTSKEILAASKAKSIDFVIGGPPCQAFSVFGKRKGLEDPRGNLVFQYARLIKEIQPEGFLFENVAGLKSIHNGKLYDDLFDVLSINGLYKISAHEYEVADFGIPQFRKRVFFIGSKSKLEIPKMLPTHFSNNNLFQSGNKYRTVDEAILGLPSPIKDWKEVPYLNGHVGRNHSERIIDRYDSLTYGERDPKTRINKLDPKRPSYTIIVGSDKGGGKGHVHPFEPREVTPRESARIQTFPDWWKFSGTGRHIIRQVGNAVPPLFAAQIAQMLAKNIFGIENNSNYQEVIEKLELSFLEKKEFASVDS